MTQWIPFGEGDYLAEQAFLITPDLQAVFLERLTVTVYTNPGGIRSLEGAGLVRPYLIVALLEDNDHMDLVIDFGSEFKYRLPKPDISAGKVFSPDISAVMQVTPVTPWRPIDEGDYERLLKRIRVLTV